MTAVMITAARVALGMKAVYGIRNARHRMTRAPVYSPPMLVLTPLAQLTAVLENDPVMGIDWTKLAAMLQKPSANISWEASTGFPLAENMMINVQP